MRLLFLSTPVGALGSGAGGGVELTLLNVANEMLRRGHLVTIVAPSGSRARAIPLIHARGTPQKPMQQIRRDAPVAMPADSVLARMCDIARRQQHRYDIIVNFAYDWLPFYLTPFFRLPVAHLVSMCSMNDAMDAAIGAVVESRPGTVAMHTRAQAKTYCFNTDLPIVLNGIDTSRYAFNARPQRCIAWAGRIAPEKGIEDAIAAAGICGLPLRIMGAVEDRAYWRRVRAEARQARIAYCGYLATPRFQKRLGQCMAIFVTPQWVEAFGNVIAEALACGVPAIAYRRGGPAEIVRHGSTGFLVRQGDISGLVSAVERVGRIDRAACRRQAEEEFSIAAMGDRLERWFERMLETSTRSLVELH